MKKILLISAVGILLSIIMQSCMSMYNSQMFMGNKYLYYYDLEVNGEIQDILGYEDEDIDIDFTITDKEVKFTLKNKMNELLKVDWEKVIMVRHGVSERIMHTGVKYTDRNTTQAATYVAPGTILSDLVLPVSGVTYYKGYYSTYYSSPASWIKADLFLTNDMNKQINEDIIMSNKGKNFTLYFPVENQSGKVINYQFIFHIKHILKIDKNNSEDNYEQQ